MSSLAANESLGRRSTAGLGRWGVIRLGLVQAALGAIVIFVTSSISRLMVVEHGLPALIPGCLVALHYGVQILRPRWGYGSDVGGRRTPWIVGGMLALAIGNVGAAIATTLMSSDRALALGLAGVAYLLVGVGVGATGTSLLVLLAKRVEPPHRAAAATTVWIMMIGGFIATAAFVGTMLDPFSPTRLLQVAVAISAVAVLVTLAAVWKIEPVQAHGRTVDGHGLRTEASGFRRAMADVWREPQARRFAIFVFLSMFAYSAQELILEPFGGFVFALTPGASAKLTGVQHAGLLVGMLVVAGAGSLFAGRRLGTMAFWTVGGCLGSAGALLGLAASGMQASLPMMRLCVFGLGVTNGAFSIAAIGAMMQLAGSGRATREGTRMGLWGAAQAVAFATGGLVATGATDLTRHLIASPLEAYLVVFLGEALVFCAAAHLALTVFASGRAAACEGADDAPIGQTSLQGVPAP